MFLCENYWKVVESMNNSDLNIIVSVVIPAFNARAFISDAIDSVLAQNVANIEIIIINDHSTDSTLSVLEEYRDKIVIITNEKNSGASFSRNQGIKAAKGKYIAFLDADDIWVENKLSRQLELINKHPDSEFVFGSALFTLYEDYDEAMLSVGKVKGEAASIKTLNDIFSNPYLSTSTMLVSKALCIDVGLFREDLKTAEDIDFCLRLAAKTAPIEMKAALSITRRVDNSLGGADSSYKDNLDVIEDFVEKRPLFKASNIESIKKMKRKIYDDWLEELVYRRQITLAIKVFVHSLEVFPSFHSIKLLAKACILFWGRAGNRKKI